MDFGLHFILFCYGLALYLLSFYINCVYVWEYILHFFEESIDQKSFDYVIVGCGTAGSLLAHQLSALGNVSYVVLEAGGYGGPLLNPPALGPLLQHSSYDWQYKTVPQKNACFGLKNKVCSWPMGKILGGSAKLNNMVHIRGYLNDMVPWFGGRYDVNTLEKYLLDLEETNLPYNKISYKTSLSSAILNAGIELGYDIVDSNISESKIGFMEPILNQVNGARWSTSHTLLNTNANGNILTNALAHKIIFDGKYSRIAKGISFERFGRNMFVYAKKGVILSAGAIGSPKLLMLSGIGPKSQLNNLNISVIRDLPVGDNLMDHVTTGLDLVLLDKPLDFNLKSLLNPINAWSYFVNGDGPWTASGCEAVAFVNTNELCDNKTRNIPYTNVLSSDKTCNIRNINELWESKTCNIPNANALCDVKTCDILNTNALCDIETCSNPNTNELCEDKTCTNPNTNELCVDITCTDPNTNVLRDKRTCNVQNKKELYDIKTCNNPNLQLMILPLGLSTDYGLHLKSVIGISDYVWEHYFSNLFSNNSVTILPIVLQPRSKGKVYLSTGDPNDLPVIDPRYFSEKKDIDVILYGIDMIKKILKTESMKNLGAKLNPIPFPGCENHVFDSRSYWKCYVKHMTLTTYHPVGTCKMGSADDVTAIVNYDFSVKGVKNLYVVDASIFPTMVSGNTNMAVALVAKIFSQMFYNGANLFNTVKSLV